MLSERIGAMSAGDSKASLDDDEDIEEAWAIEVERRITEIESGAVPVIPIEQALCQIRSTLTLSKAMRPSPAEAGNLFEVRERRVEHIREERQDPER
jgi:hypothetical protein